MVPQELQQLHGWVPIVPQGSKPRECGLQKPRNPHTNLEFDINSVGLHQKHRPVRGHGLQDPTLVREACPAGLQHGYSRQVHRLKGDDLCPVLVAADLDVIIVDPIFVPAPLAPLKLWVPPPNARHRPLWQHHIGRNRVVDLHRRCRLHNARDGIDDRVGLADDCAACLCDPNHVPRASVLHVGHVRLYYTRALGHLQHLDDEDPPNSEVVTKLEGAVGISPVVNHAHGNSLQDDGARDVCREAQLWVFYALEAKVLGDVDPQPEAQERVVHRQLARVVLCGVLVEVLECVCCREVDFVNDELVKPRDVVSILSSKLLILDGLCLRDEPLESCRDVDRLLGLCEAPVQVWLHILLPENDVGA
mmetsp:Transcript_17351/g.42406  ORF Transcript_17351/g.42406 Transcript_17351/m.42406 type:complete len:362 (+) Transcript_17351:800-1885(+)